MTILQRLARALVFLVGRWSWVPPSWPRDLGRGLGRGGHWVRAHRQKSAALLVLLVALGSASFVGVRWYRHRPKPIEVAVTVNPPGLTPIADPVRPQALSIDFDGSVAPLAAINKVVTAGIALSPRHEGTWRWASDQRLVFIPKVDWPVGQAFTIALAKKGLVAAHVRLDRYELPFSSEGFAVRLAEARFYQDPVDPDLKKVVATFSFTHPVDSATFESHLHMHLVPSDREDRESHPGFRVTYDKLKGQAFVHSLALALPRKDATLVLVLDKGVRAARGGPPFAAELTEKVLIPGLFNFLKVTSVNVTLVDNDRYEPEQVLLLEATAGINEAEMQRSVSAFLLPEKDAKGKPQRWGDPAAVGKEILAQAEAVKLTRIASEREFATLTSFKFSAPVGRQLYVRVNKGMRAFGGYILSETFQQLITVPPYPRQLKILHSGALLALGGERKVSVFARDIPSIRFELARVLPGGLVHLVSQTDGSLATPGFRGSFGPDNLTEVFSETHALEAARPGKPQYEALDLSQYLAAANGERRGLFFLTVQSWDPARNQPLGESDTRLILVSDLGIIAKENTDHSFELFVQSIRTGQAVPRAQVQVLGRNGLPILNQTTDAAGHAHLPKLTDFRNEKAPTLFLVSSGRDQSFLPFGRHDRLLDTSRFDVGGVSEEATDKDPARGLTAYLFTDRGLYRPGDEVRVGMVVKNRDFASNLGGLPLEVVVTDARRLVVRKERIKLGATGFEELRHSTPEVAPTGTYAVNLYIVKDDHPSSLLGSATFEVREFLPDRMKIRVGLSTESPEGWVSPKDLKGRVTLTNLFGTAAAGRRVRSTLALSPWLPAFGKLRDYRFFDPLRAKDGVNENLPDATTDDEGSVELDLGLGRFAPATYRLSLLAEGFEAEGGRSVTAEASVVVSPLPFLVGYKADGDLGYVTRDADRSLELVAIDPAGQRTAVPGLKAVLYERQYVSVLVRQDNGTYRYQSVKKELERGHKALEIGAQGRKFKLATDKAGDFTLVIRNAREEDQQRIEYTVAGFGNLSREVEKNAELKLALKTNDVEPGGSLQMQIKAPFVGAGLITVERDRVYAWKWFKADTSATVQSIDLPPELEGGGYVSVSFVRDPGSPEVFMSPLSYGVLPFSINRARRKVAITVDTPELARPGAPFKMRYRTDRPAKIVVFAVDEGILRVAHYEKPDPLGFFFQKRALGVRTSQILDMILPEYGRLLSALAPGGDEDAAIGANLNPFRRKQQKPVTFWSGIVDAGPKERELIYDIPDHFNGTLRVMAVAVAPEALGAFESHALIRGDFVISPNAPTFAAPGDETEVTVGVTNAVIGSGKDAAVTLALKTSAGLEVLDGTERKLTITEMREGTARFKLRARAPLGSAQLIFTASHGNKSAHLTSELSVRPAVAYTTTLKAGHLRDTEVTIPIDRHLHAEQRTLAAGLSYVPLGLAHGLVSYLEAFPHGCTEQIVSQIVPQVVLGKHPEFGIKTAPAAAAVARWITLLRARQNEEGAFGRWAANPEVDETASVWATHLLLEARERDFTVPKDLLDAALGHVQTLANGDADGLPGQRLRAYATYVLTIAGQATARVVGAHVKHLEANHRQTWRQDLTGMYVAATYRLLRQDRPAKEIAALAKLGQARETDYQIYYDRLAHDGQVLYLLARHFPELAAQLSAADITGLADPIFNGSYNTFSSAWAILGLETYARAASAQTAGKLAISEKVGPEWRALSLTAGLLPRAAFSDRAAEIRFGNAGAFDAYWVVAQRGFDLEPPRTPLTGKIEVFREYTGADGKPLGAVKLGDEVTVHIRVRALGAGVVDNLAIVDLLPGGFEPVIQARAKPSGDEASTAEGEGQGEGEGEGSEGEGDGEGRESGVPEGATFALPIALPGATFLPTYGDVREDRVVLYGSATAEVKEFIYAVKATNVGTYTTAPVLGDSMYDRSIVAHGAAGTISVTAR